jgi:hypothetical protein
MKKEKGSLTMIAFFTILIFSLYGILLYGKSASAYIRQTKSIEAIQNAYAEEVNNAVNIAESLGASYHLSTDD